MPSFKFASATGSGSSLIVTCSEQFAGKTITCTNGTKTYTRTCPSTSPYEVVFKGVAPGTWTVSGVVEGTTYSQQVVITDFDVILTAGFDYRQWVTLGGLDPTDYTDLEDVFADEVAVRRLMTIHASADYLIEKVTDDIDTIDDFVANDIAMKWIGLRDYVCDGLTAITGVEAKFLASQYWERYLKDHVPVMTSNTAPYGTASATSTYSGRPAYYVFDGDNSTRWSTADGNVGTTQRIQYAFTNPIRVNHLSALLGNPENGSSYKIVASNDNSTWIEIASITDLEANIQKDISFENDEYYIYWGVSYTKDVNMSTNIYMLQFYGRSLNVSVPVMTSNTAPYGEAFDGGHYADKLPWKAFDNQYASNSDANEWASQNNTQGDRYVGYDFGKSVCVKMAVEMLGSHNSNNGRPGRQKYQGWNGTEWIDLLDITSGLSDLSWLYHNISNTNGYEKYRAIYSDIQGDAVWSTGVKELQFYGVDYSEREFAEGSTMKYLYDHGVELETFIAQKGSSTTSVSPSWDGEELYFPPLAGTNNNRNNFSFYETSYDLTNFDLLRATFGFDFKICFSMAIFSSAQSSGTYDTNVAIISPTSITLPNTDLALDISAINQTKYIDVGVMYVNGRSGSIKELWLE